MPSYGYAQAPAFKRLVRRSAGWRPVSWFYAHALDHIDRWSWRLTGERVLFSNWLSGLPVLLLTTRGARSGQERTSPLLGIPQDGDALLVIGSNYGGPRHPAWVHNLRAHHDVRVRFEGRERPMVAHELTGDAWRAAFAHAEQVYPAWAIYRRRAAPRVIRVFRLEPRP